MTELYEVVQPRPEVLAGELTDALFAAGLEEVVADTAADIYREPERFFAGTYPSRGLRTLLDEALGRLGGKRPEGASVIRLETSFGGGKTHNLIALYHAARGRLSLSLAGEFMDADLLPTEAVGQVGVFVGTEAGATSFPEVEGIAPSTLWGYLALQIGGRNGYNLVRSDDEAHTAPGADAIKKLFGDRPTLVLIDEIARYYRTAKGVAVEATTLARQTTAFLMALLQAVDSLPRAVLVITTTNSADAFGDEAAEVVEALMETASLLARKELVLRPSDEADLPRILARRLFEPIGIGLGQAAGAHYAETADSAVAQGLDLPPSMTGAGWAGEVARSYPFHPSLIRVLDKRLSTIPNFQRTRGALRLLAQAVRRLWEIRPPGTELIHLHHIDLGDARIAEELSSRLKRAGFEPVIRADVAGRPGAEVSHAEDVDVAMGNSYPAGPAYGRRLAITAYLYSLTEDVPSVPPGQLFGATLAPGDDLNLLVKALDNLSASCWYLHSDLRGVRFSTEANLVAMIAEAEREITPAKARTQATKILGEQFRDGALKVRRAWQDAKVPDNYSDAWLAVQHWDDFGDARGIDPAAGVPAKVAQLFERAPDGGLREFRNRVCILAPSTGSHESMVNTVRRHLALESLATNAETLASLSTEKQVELRTKAKESLLLARVAVCNHVNVAFVPQAGGLDVVALDVATQASVQRNQADAVLGRLEGMGKTLAAGDKPLDPGYIRAKLGSLLDAAVPTEELVRAFARRTDLKMVLDRALLVNLVVAGVRNGVWEYQDPERGADGWGTVERPTTAVRLAEDTYIHPLGSAPPRTPLACPLCGQVHTGLCPEGADGLAGGGGPGGDALGTSTFGLASSGSLGASIVGSVAPTSGHSFTASGAAGKAFADARAAAAEAGRHELHELSVEVDHLGAGAGVELARLYTVVSPSLAGALVTYRVEVVVELSKPGHSAEVRFEGDPAEYSPLREALKALLSSREAKLHARLNALFDPAPALSGEDVGRLARAASDTGPTRCTVTMSTEAGP